MRTKAVAVLAVLFTLARPAPAAAWGTEVHKFITARAIALLPAEIRPFFEKYTTKLELETGSGLRKPSGATVVVQPAASYSKQWRGCRA